MGAAPSLAGLPVVVTGGAGALGAAVVARLLEAGAVCHLPLRAALEHRVWGGHPNLRLTPGIDLADEAAVTGFYAALPSLWASVHLAGGFVAAPVQDSDGALLDRMLNANLRTTFLCTRSAIGAMRARPSAAGRGGRIVNVASRQALDPRAGAGLSAYTAAKAGVAALTVALAAEVAGEGILVNAVAPAIIDTPANRAAMPQADWSRWTRPADIAEAILFLASPANRAASGGTLPVGAGG